MPVSSPDWLQHRSWVLGVYRAWPKNKYWQLGLLTSSLCSYYGRVSFWTTFYSQLLFPLKIRPNASSLLTPSIILYNTVWQIHNLHLNFPISSLIFSQLVIHFKDPNYWPFQVFLRATGFSRVITLLVFWLPSSKPLSWSKTFVSNIVSSPCFLWKYHMSDLHFSSTDVNFAGFVLKNSNTFLCWRYLFALSPAAGTRLTGWPWKRVRLKHVATHPHDDDASSTFTDDTRKQYHYFIVTPGNLTLADTFLLFISNVSIFHSSKGLSVIWKLGTFTMCPGLQITDKNVK